MGETVVQILFLATNNKAIYQTVQADSFMIFLNNILNSWSLNFSWQATAWCIWLMKSAVGWGLRLKWMGKKSFYANIWHVDHDY